MRTASTRWAEVLLAAALAALAGGCVAPGKAAAARTAVTLSPLFGDHAVLQSGRPVPVWGRAAPGDAVAVSYRGQAARATAGPDGRWSVTLAPRSAFGA